MSASVFCIDWLESKMLAFKYISQNNTWNTRSVICATKTILRFTYCSAKYTWVSTILWQFRTIQLHQLNAMQPYAERYVGSLRSLSLLLLLDKTCELLANWFEQWFTAIRMYGMHGQRWLYTGRRTICTVDTLKLNYNSIVYNWKFSY